MKSNQIHKLNRTVLAALLLTLTACSTNKLPQLPSATAHPSLTSDISNYNYLIGPGDSLEIFVWRNPEISGSYQVRPDGMVSTSLVEDIDVSGQTPTDVARVFEDKLSKYIRTPIVTVIVNRFVGPYSEQVRVIGEAANPKSISYRENMSLLDVMIEVGGLTEFADGNSSRLVRIIDGKQQEFSLSVDSLIRDGEIKANVDMLPGDIIIIPDSWF
ncbi:MAG: polysaccharide export protein [Aliivibrio sp.]|uniref:XrtA/PEP-CTERM system exopolysaccharide export protein n=1 Tax=Aliivibrio sp. TaxID=1872443 RepID=UPI001A57FAB5|nr:polysaccharide export protein [Aliivibrio sp.]